MVLWFKLFYVFFKVGLFSFGGGYAMLPMIYQDIQTFGLMEAREFSNVVALSQVTPGPIAVNAATYVGFRSAGWGGAIFATLGVCLPSIIIILIIAVFMVKFKNSPVVQAVLQGIRPATVGMLAAAVIFFAKTSLVSAGFFSLKMMQNPLEFISLPALVIFFLTIWASKKGKVGPIPLTLLAGVAGIWLF
ncbi:MAG TPA: chromate transporter [Bacillota bacterium]|nr:chromate transporter [Bacillota bacterium]